MREDLQEPPPKGQSAEHHGLDSATQVQGLAGSQSPNESVRHFGKFLGVIDDLQGVIQGGEESYQKALDASGTDVPRVAVLTIRIPNIALEQSLENNSTTQQLPEHDTEEAANKDQATAVRQCKYSRHFRVAILGRVLLAAVRVKARRS